MRLCGSAVSDDEAMARMWQSYANVIWVHIFWIAAGHEERDDLATSPRFDRARLMRS